MKKIWPMLALGLSAYVVFALVSLPAHVITDRLASTGVNLLGVEGTVWKGSAQAVQVANINVGRLQWSLRPLALFMAQLSVDVEVSRSNGLVSGRVGYQLLSGNISLARINAALPINTLPPELTQGGWEGTLRANLSELVLEKGWPASAKGTIEAMNLVGPARKPSNIGSFKVSFPAAKPVPNTLTGDLSSTDGPLRIVATLQLKAANRSYLIEGQVATQPGTPEDLSRTLQILGAPDAQGNRPFSLEGTL